MTTPIVLANDALRLDFSPDTGALTGLTAVGLDWPILDRPHLGLSFKLQVPNGRRHNNPVDGEKQKLTSHRLASDGTSVHFVWDGVDSLHAGRLDIRVEMEVRLESAKAVWSVTIVNQSGLVVEAVHAPYLGDLRHPPGSERFGMTLANYAGPNHLDLWPQMPNRRGYFGVDQPTVMGGFPPGTAAPMLPFALLRTDQQGLFVGIDSRSWDFVGPMAELLPGYRRSIDARVPEGDRIGQHEVQTRFGMVHLPYIQPGETRALTPIAIAPYRGTWHAGCDLYRNSTVRPPSAVPPAWVKEPHSWLQIHVNSPEGEARIAYRDLVPLAAELKKHGILGFQITGWNRGGQDQDNPSHDTDPLLGSWDDLRDAIRQIQALGVKVILFAKYTWADRHTEWFRQHLHRLAVTDPNGDYYVYKGYQYQTPAQLFDINTRRLIPMCFLSDEYLAICDAEFRKIVALGADGFLFDECMHHNPAFLCFHPDHGHRPGMPCYANDNHLIERFHRISDPVRPDFCFAGEALYDWEFAAYHLSYFRTDSTQHSPWHRYLRPEGAIMTAVTGFDDREMVAQCLLYRYIISYEPFNFKGRPEDYPLTLAYGKQMDALRAELRRWFWDGEFRDTQGATVTGADGKPHHPYTVFLPQGGGAPGLVIANYDLKDPAAFKVAIDGQDLATYRYRLIDDPTWKPALGGITIPARSAVVLVANHPR